MDFVEVDGIDSNIELDTTALDPTHVVERRAPPFSTQSQPVIELRVMSQPTTVPDISRMKNYVYNEKAAAGTYLYMVESGINTSPIVSLFYGH